jgi:hypothetical protein
MRLSTSGAQRKNQFWEEAVTNLTSVTQAFPQAGYPGLHKSLRQEWQFVQSVTKGVSPKFVFIEQTLAKTFLPTLFGNEYDKKKTLPCSS